jgi:hypothetical protein
MNLAYWHTNKTYRQIAEELNLNGQIVKHALETLEGILATNKAVKSIYDFLTKRYVEDFPYVNRSKNLKNNFQRRQRVKILIDQLDIRSLKLIHRQAESYLSKSL